MLDAMLDALQIPNLTFTAPKRRKLKPYFRGHRSGFSAL